MFWQMTEMKNRYYKDLKPSSIVSYFHFGTLNPFSGVQQRIIISNLDKQGDYWGQLKKKDKSGWTKRIK